MHKKKKTLITSRRFERITVRRRSGRLSCGICGEASELLSIEESGLVFGVNLRSIFRLVENGEVHFAESPAGLLLICTATLQQALMKPER